MMESLRVGVLFLPDPDYEKPIKVEDQSPIILTYLCAKHVCKALNQLQQFYDEQTSMEAWRKGRAQSEQLITHAYTHSLCVQTEASVGQGSVSFPFLFPVVQTTHSA